MATPPLILQVLSGAAAALQDCLEDFGHVGFISIGQTGDWGVLCLTSETGALDSFNVLGAMLSWLHVAHMDLHVGAALDDAFICHKHHLPQH